MAIRGLGLDDGRANAAFLVLLISTRERAGVPPFQEGGLVGFCDVFLGEGVVRYDMLESTLRYARVSAF